MNVLCCVAMLTMAADQNVVQEEFTVKYKESRVHVIDKAGHPVEGLVLEDFVLTLDGKPVEATFFQEIRGDAASDVTGETSEVRAVAETENRYILLFIDSGQMTEPCFEGAKKAAQNLIQRQLNPRTFIKLVQLDGEYRELTGFTRSRAALDGAIEQLAYRGGMVHEGAADQIRLERAQTTYFEALAAGDDGSGDGLNPFANLKSLWTNAAFNVTATRYNHFAGYYNAMIKQIRVFENIRGAKSVFMLTAGHFSHYGENVNEALTRALNTADTTAYVMMFDHARPARFARGEFDQRVALTHQARDTAVATGGVFVKTPFAREGIRIIT